jgi:hypothetical protein
MFLYSRSRLGLAPRGIHSIFAVVSFYGCMPRRRISSFPKCLTSADRKHHGKRILKKPKRGILCPKRLYKIAEVCSEDVNEYLNAISGQTFTAKDFRTWAGTVLAASALSQMEEVDTKAAAKKNVLTTIEAVARMLGNTAAICRKCYIHPAVITRYMDGRLAQTLRVKADLAISDRLYELKPEEAAVLSLLRGELDRR